MARPAMTTPRPPRVSDASYDCAPSLRTVRKGDVDVVLERLSWDHFLAALRAAQCACDQPKERGRAIQ